jgi:hypothetical protein
MVPATPVLLTASVSPAASGAGLSIAFAWLKPAIPPPIGLSAITKIAIKENKFVILFILKLLWLRKLCDPEYSLEKILNYYSYCLLMKKSWLFCNQRTNKKALPF